MTSSDTATLAAALVLILVWFIALVGFYLWYGWALSRLFKRLGIEGWRGWVPVLNEMTIFERGGVPAWNVVFYFLPFVNLYALYLKFVAASRIGTHFGRGQGFAVLAVLLPPVWATMLAMQQPANTGQAHERIASVVGHRQVASGLAGAPQAQAPTSQAPSAPAPSAPAPSAPAPSAQAPAV